MQEWGFSAPCQAFQSRGLASGGGTPRAFGSEGQKRLTAGVPRDWGKQRLHSQRVHTGLMHARTQEQSNDSIGAWADLPAGLGGCPGITGNGCGSLWGHQSLWKKYQGVFIYLNSCWRQTHCLGNHYQDLASPNSYSTASKRSCWDTQGQTTNKEGRSPTR